MNRRKVITGTGIALFTPMIGCLDRNQSTEDDMHNDNDTSGEDENDDIDTEPQNGEEDTYDESRQDPIFIENTTDDEIVVEVFVEQKSSGEELIENKYEVPSKTGLEIPSIADVGSEYRITAKFDGMVEEYDWTVLTCARGPGAGTGTALGVEIAEGELYILHTDCDEIGAGEKIELTYENHEEYIID
ncbi:hypothetical protein [Natronobeatus ordinarius]|uniref:hypothetical protein n=1 Tax=Natronobeatus ordinarius TaxID=2963433 RepID=UPI0020CC7FAF|nr:hypothetical protein [Natronobeatus ordinarius]